MKVLHIGNSTISYTRYIDFVSDEKLTVLYILTSRKHNLFNKIVNACGNDEKFRQHSHKIVEIQYELGLIYEFIEKLFNYSIKFNYLSNLIRTFLKQFRFFIEVYFYCKKFNSLTNLLKEEKIDIIWSGSNNFDDSNILTWFVSKKCNLEIIRSYKETNGIYMLDEYMALKVSKGLIFPNLSTFNHFSALYSQINFASKSIIFADEDYRYSGLISTVRDNDLISQKYSKKSKEPHIVILTGRATFGKNDSFTNNRYNYLKLIQDFVNMKVHVHLHYGFIFDSDKRIIINNNENPYSELSVSNSYFHMERKLDLEKNRDDYLVLNKYDAGILHNYDPNDKISVFSNFNVPNRLFEYQIANVKPILIRNTMLEVEKILIESNFGVIGNSYEEIAEKLKSNLDCSELIEDRFIHSFRRFVESFFAVSKIIICLLCVV